MTAQIPWVVQPATRTTKRLGNDSTGIIEMPVCGGLLTGEDRLIGELIAEQGDLQKAEAELCDLIATSEGITLMEARQIILNYANNAEQDPAAAAIADKHAAAIATYQALTRSYGYLLMDATVTALMVGRLGMKGWTIEDTRNSDQMTRGLYLAIWEFAQEEAAAERGEKSEVTEESLGKPSAAPPARKRTGKSSSGS
jgi:hypothetical protein